MSSSHHSSNPAGGFGGARPNGGIFDVFDQLRTAFEAKAPSRMNRGDVRTAVLALLAEKPMHGYQIISEIERRSGGSWKPSPGSVYPTLQLLADENLIKAEESGGRKTYSLTDEGREVVDAAGEEAAPWESAGTQQGSRGTALPKAGMELAQAAAQVGRSGTPEQVEEAVELLNDVRRKLYAILARG